MTANERSSTMSPFNSEMLQLRREALGLTQTELAQRAQISQAKISKLEAGLTEPDQPTIEVLSRALGRNRRYFFQSDRLYGPGVAQFHHRRLQSVGVKALRQVHARINENLMTVERLLRAVEIDTTGFAAVADLRDGMGDSAPVVEVARAVRAIWRIPKGPIRDLVAVIEEAGGIVFECQLPPQIDGMCWAVSRVPPCFFLNADKPGDRLRWTLAHELGHAVLHQKPRENMEDEANQFAAEFLMPEHEIRPQLNKVTLERLARLKPHWRTSMASILYRARALNKITDRQYRYLWTQMGRKGYRRREPPELDIPKERPTLLRELFEAHTEDLYYTKEELEELLLMDWSEIEARYPAKLDSAKEDGPFLKLVK